MNLQEKQLWTGVFTILFIAFVIGLLCGCTTPPKDFSVKPAVDSLTVVQTHLSLVDDKAVVVENYLRSH